MSSSEEPLVEDEEVEEEEALLNNNDDDGDDDDDDDDDVLFRELKRITINHGEFSKEERRVADILVQLSELIATSPGVALMDQPPWLFKKTRTGINILSAPPPSPRDHYTASEASERLAKELHHLMEQNNILNLELKKVSTYCEKKRAFNLRLKEVMETSLQEDKNRKTSCNTSNKMEVCLPPSSTKIETHDQNQERMVAGGEGSTSLKLEHNHQVLQFDYQPSSANGLETPDQSHGLPYGGVEPTSPRLEADGLNQELLCTDEVLEDLEIDQDMGGK